MTKSKTITLQFGERIIAVVPEFCSGPGWANSPMWVYIMHNDGSVRTVCIQPEERTPALHALHAAGAAMHSALLRAIPVKENKR